MPLVFHSFSTGQKPVDKLWKTSDTNLNIFYLSGAKNIYAPVENFEHFFARVKVFHSFSTGRKAFFDFSTGGCGKVVALTQSFPQSKVFHSFSTPFSTVFPQPLCYNEHVAMSYFEFSTLSTGHNNTNNYLINFLLLLRAKIGEKQEET
jgi:hypothetical protein